MLNIIIKICYKTVMRIGVDFILGGCKQEKINPDLLVKMSDLICFSWCSKSEVRDWSLDWIFSNIVRMHYLTSYTIFCQVINSLLNDLCRNLTPQKKMQDNFTWKLTTQRLQTLTQRVKMLKWAQNCKATTLTHGSFQWLLLFYKWQATIVVLLHSCGAFDLQTQFNFMYVPIYVDMNYVFWIWCWN